MRFGLGLVIGILLGGAGVYLTLEQPGDQVAVASDAGVTATASKTRQRKRSRRQRNPKSERRAADAVPVLTAADRAMVWKGAVVKLPPRQLDLGADDDSRPLNHREINQVIRAQSEPILSCIAKARGNAPLDGEIVAKMLVDGTGKVAKSRFRAPAYLFAHGFAACARKAAQTMDFPATGAATVVEVPYHLR